MEKSEFEFTFSKFFKLGKIGIKIQSISSVRELLWKYLMKPSADVTTMDRTDSVTTLWKILQVFGKLLTVYFLFGKTVNLFWLFCFTYLIIFIVANGQILKHNLTLWSHWAHSFLSFLIDWDKNLNQSEHFKLGSLDTAWHLVTSLGKIISHPDWRYKTTTFS